MIASTRASVNAAKCRTGKRKITLFAALTALTCGSVPGAFAQCLSGGACEPPGCELFVFDGAVEPAELEGPILSVACDGLDAIISVLGRTIRVTPGTPIASTSNPALTVAQLCDPTPFPGRGQPGFVGGTGIVVSNGRDISTGELCASDVFVEPAEHGIGGPLDVNNFNADLSGSAIMMGIELRIVNDPRLPAIVLTDTGLRMDPSTARVGALAGAEGYFGDDGVLYVAIFEASGEAADPGEQVAVSRAQCREDDRIGVLGGSTEANGTVQVCDASDPTRCFGTATVTAANLLDPALGGEWRMQTSLDGDCPDQVRVTLFGVGASGLATTVADVDIR